MCVREMRNSKISVLLAVLAHSQLSLGNTALRQLERLNRQQLRWYNDPIWNKPFLWSRSSHGAPRVWDFPGPNWIPVWIPTSNILYRTHYNPKVRLYGEDLHKYTSSYSQYKRKRPIDKVKSTKKHVVHQNHSSKNGEGYHVHSTWSHSSPHGVWKDFAGKLRSSNHPRSHRQSITKKLGNKDRLRNGFWPHMRVRNQAQDGKSRVTISTSYLDGDNGKGPETRRKVVKVVWSNNQPKEVGIKANQGEQREAGELIPQKLDLTKKVGAEDKKAESSQSKRDGFQREKHESIETPGNKGNFELAVVKHLEEQPSIILEKQEQRSSLEEAKEPKVLETKAKESLSEEKVIGKVDSSLVPDKLDDSDIKKLDKVEDNQDNLIWSETFSSRNDGVGESKVTVSTSKFVQDSTKNGNTVRVVWNSSAKEDDTINQGNLKISGNSPGDGAADSNGGIWINGVRVKTFGPVEKPRAKIDANVASEKTQSVEESKVISTSE